jgi:hypothetical protein
MMVAQKKYLELNMIRLLIIAMILTCSSCMVSKRTYDAKCAEILWLSSNYDTQIEELKAENAAWLWKDQLCREHVLTITNELKALKDTTKVIEGDIK